MGCPLSAHVEVGHFGDSVMAISCCLRVHETRCDAPLGRRSRPLKLPCGIAARVDVIDVELRSVSIDGKLELELHAVSPNGKIANRARGTDSGPPQVRSGGRVGSLPSCIALRARAQRTASFIFMTPFGTGTHEMARHHAVGRRFPSHMPEGTTPDASTKNPVEGKVMIPRSRVSKGPATLE